MLHLTKNDIEALKVKLGYQTGTVAIERDVLDALIASYEGIEEMETDNRSKNENLLGRLENAQGTIDQLQDEVSAIKSHIDVLKAAIDKVKGKASKASLEGPYNEIRNLIDGMIF